MRGSMISGGVTAEGFCQDLLPAPNGTVLGEPWLERLAPDRARSILLRVWIPENGLNDTAFLPDPVFPGSTGGLAGALGGDRPLI